ncbi:response regulator transcription factor [Pusillimonas sp. CC-YST705]|uniref:Response regulator transcription factor n=1 Tax=Mesopusillimonas faecipullorum TaxID=2755040 RepID=A0ABS8C8W9_9BURK|nr:response regulator transcription factor [Mesopusillimonas faecipullorum]MCB5362282.1 response regulator transcription factor [Mesopusillimonas faecipullorum]
MNIASLEDEPTQAQLIQQVLEQAGHTCTSFATGKSLLAVLQKPHDFDMVLVDWELPDLAGIEVVRWVRLNLGYELPVMFVTSRVLEEDLVEGLQAGADDYLVKPIRAGELLARIEALARRSAFSAPKIQRPTQVGPYEIDDASNVICLRGEAVTLAPKEYELAVLFLRNPWRLFSRDVLSAAVWNREIPPTSRTLDTHLSNIRQKLNLRPENGVRLTSSYALGYRLELIADESAAQKE